MEIVFREVLVSDLPTRRLAKEVTYHWTVDLAEECFFFQPFANFVHSFAGFEIAEDERASAAHFFAVSIHHAEVGSYVWCELGFVDDHEV